MRTWSRATAALLGAAVVVAFVSYGTRPIATVRAAALALPTDHLHFGISNDPGDLSWMTGSGVPWKYRYTYLSNGVNTGKGWETWNSPPGEYATLYMNDSYANGYIPMFPYYELLQSTPSIGTDEISRNYSNLNNTTTMKAYYANFALLMQKAAAFGKLVVVQVEPDLFGFMEYKAAGGDASTVSASVASSGYAGLGTFPNTFQGFAWAMLKLRDTIAPNVVMVTHASTWASGFDIARNTDPSFNMAADADTVAAFLGSAGLSTNAFASTFDVVSNDVSDRDSGTASGYWWDRSDTTLPNFKQWLTWMTELRARTGRPLVEWQVPVGNQYFRTMNQTDGHYQDNRAEYFLSHVSALQAAGIIAVMFGSGGNAGSTTNTDYKADGVTNPAPVSTFQCSFCNTHVSLWSDDDGGYLRIFVGLYYQSIASPPCVSGGVTANKTSPQAFGTAVTFTATSTGCKGPPEYAFYVYGQGAWTLVQPYSPSTTWNLDYSKVPANGTYTIDVWVRNTGSINAYDTYGLMSWVVGGCNFATTTNTSGTIYTTTAGGVACTNPEYKVWMVGNGRTWWNPVDWSSTNTFDASTVAGLNPGSYTVDVWVRQHGSSTNTNYFETWGLATYISGGACSTAKPTLAAGPASPSSSGTAVNFTATGCGAVALYEYWLYPGAGGGWQSLRAYTLTPTYSLNPNTLGLAAGNYSIVVWAKGLSSQTTSYDSYAVYSYEWNGCTVASLSADKANPQAHGTTVTFTAISSGCANPQYSFWILPIGGAWSNPQPYSSVSTWAWTPASANSYAIIVWAREQGGPTSAGAFETYDARSFSAT